MCLLREIVKDKKSSETTKVLNVEIEKIVVEIEDRTKGKDRLKQNLKNGQPESYQVRDGVKTVDTLNFPRQLKLTKQKGKLGVQYLLQIKV